MALDTDKLYYLNLPQGTRSYLATGILPVVQRAVGEDFSRLREVLYLKVKGDGAVYTLPIKTNPPVNDFDSALSTEPEASERQQVLHLASHICLYMHTNERSLKLLALYHEPDSPEEPLLRKAVQFVNDECQQESSEALKKIVLEELVVKP